MVNATITQPALLREDIVRATGFVWSNTTASSFDYTNRLVSDKTYELANHLGNVLAVITDRKIELGTSNIYTADVVSYSDYSPYGTLLDHRHGTQSGSDAYRYGFQGQEKDDEIKGEGNSYNYTYRMHDPRIGRFFAIDPLADKYPFYTPYAFSGNQVIHMVELEGLEPKKVGEDGWISRYWWHTKGANQNDMYLAVGAGFINAIADDMEAFYHLGKMVAAFDFTRSYAYTSEASQIRSEAWEMLKFVSIMMYNPILQGIVVEQIWNNVSSTAKNMDASDWSYAVGYAAWQVVSMFIGVGEISELLKAGKLAEELPKMMKGLQIAEEVVVTPTKVGDDLVEGAQTVGKFWNKNTTFDNVKVFQRDDLINPNLVDSRGRTNHSKNEKRAGTNWTRWQVVRTTSHVAK